MAEKEKITLTREEFKQKMKSVANTWAKESLGKNPLFCDAMAKIHADMLCRIEEELLGEMEGLTDDKEEAKVRGLDITASDIEAANELVKALTKLAAGKKTDVKIIKI